MSSEPAFIVPDWPVPASIRAFSTTRAGGFSSAPWSSLNLGDHVGDDPESVTKNRGLLADRVSVPQSRFCFLNQVHGTDITELPLTSPVDADGCVTTQPRVPCVIMTADCLPVLFCDRKGTCVAAAHAGWRGLCAGVLEQAVAQFEEPTEVMAWLGPAIGPRRFEVGAEVRQAFISLDPGAAEAFTPASTQGHFLADLYQLARRRLRAAGVTQIYGGDWCTFSESDRFFSYRRDGVTGRMATVIFIT